MTETILVVNAGSSSIKFQLFDVGAYDQLKRRLRGQIEGVGTRPRLVANVKGETLVEETWPKAEVSDVPAALDKVIIFLRKQIGGSLPAAVGHRVVHGGPDYSEPIVITDEVVRRLERFVPLAPLHQPNNLAPIRVILERQPRMLQVACFDTAFHRGHPEVADRYAVPDPLYEEGVRRYGFHGLSYEYISRRLGEIAPETAKGRVVVAHLGSGASMCALVEGKSVESTMGFTALDGLPMGTRPGQLDAGIVLYLLSEKRMNAKAIERLLYNDCGLKGLSGISNDVRELLPSADPRAKLALEYFVYRIVLFTGMLTAAMGGIDAFVKLALEYFVYRIVLFTGMLAAAMGGIDAFVFTAGIGENALAIREAVVRRLSWLGLELASQANAKGEQMISRKRSRVACYVIPTDEELMIASHTLQALRERASSGLKEKRA